MTSSPPSRPAGTDVGPNGLFLVILAGLGMVGPFSIDSMFPAFARMGVEFGVNELALQQIVSVYMLAFAAMSLVHGPLSDALGRKPVILVGLGVFVAASIGCALAPSLPVLLGFRAVQGLSAGAGMIVSRAMVRDVYSDDRAQRVMSHIAMIFGLAPALAPVIGGLVLGFGGWRATFWFLVAFGLAWAALVLFGMPETHPSELRTEFNVRRLASGLLDVWRRPAARRLALTAALNNGAMFLWISSAPLLVVNLLGLGETDFWVLFVPMISGMVLGSWVSGRLAGRVHGERQATVGYGIALVALVIALVLTLFPATRGLPWTVLPLPVFTFGNALAFPILTLAMLDEFPEARGSASSVQNFVALLGNAAISGLLAPALGFSLTAIAVGSLTLLVVGALLWRWHLSRGGRVPEGSPDAAAFEPLEDL